MVSSPHQVMWFSTNSLNLCLAKSAHSLHDAIMIISHDQTYPIVFFSASCCALYSVLFQTYPSVLHRLSLCSASQLTFYLVSAACDLHWVRRNSTTAPGINNVSGNYSQNLVSPDKDSQFYCPNCLCEPLEKQEDWSSWSSYSGFHSNSDHSICLFIKYLLSAYHVFNTIPEY